MTSSQLEVKRFFSRLPNTVKTQSISCQRISSQGGGASRLASAPALPATRSNRFLSWAAQNDAKASARSRRPTLEPAFGAPPTNKWIADTEARLNWRPDYGVRKRTQCSLES